MHTALTFTYENFAGLTPGMWLFSAHIHPTVSSVTDAPSSAEILSMDDHSLMVRIGKGDQKAYAQLMEKHAPRAVGFARKMIGSQADAEDVVQEAFIKVWNEAATWQPIAQFSTWFYRVMYNQCMDHLRKHKKQFVEISDELPDHADSSETRLSLAQEAKSVRDAILSLPERQRAAILLFHYQELSQADTAKTLSISESALEALLFRARQSLKNKLGNT